MRKAKLDSVITVLKKLIGARWKNPDFLDAQVALFDHLAAHGVFVPGWLKAPDGTRSVKHEAVHIRSENLWS